MAHRPTLYVVAGPNGSGKSTLTARLDLGGGAQIIDPDAIARRIAPHDPESVPVAAAREALLQQRAALGARASLVIETTLAGTSPLKTMRQAREAQYLVDLRYIRLDGADLSADRVAARVRKGGHNVPEADIRRRFAVSTENLPEAIALADTATLYDNSDPSEPHRRVAELSRDAYRFAESTPRWATEAAYRAAQRDHAQATTSAELNRAVSRALEAAEAAGIDPGTIRDIQRQGPEPGAGRHPAADRPRNRDGGRGL